MAKVPKVIAKMELKEWLKSTGRWREFWTRRDKMKAEGMNPVKAHCVMAVYYEHLDGFPESFKQHITQEHRDTALNVRT